MGQRCPRKASVVLSMILLSHWVKEALHLDLDLCSGWTHQHSCATPNIPWCSIPERDNFFVERALKLKVFTYVYMFGIFPWAFRRIQNLGRLYTSIPWAHSSILYQILDMDHRHLR